jgi:pimeloyl-ACP methyl ester carboxylesterase
MGTQASERPAEQGLRANALRLLQLTFVGLAYFSLAPVIYFNMGLMESEAGGLRLPVLLTCGRHDEAPPDTMSSFREAVAGAELVVFEESSHTAHLEETERYLEVLRRFFRRIEEPPPH